MRPVALAAMLMACLASTAPARADQVVVLAAASLKTALDRVAAEFGRTGEHQVVISYAGSNQLARQIIEGAPGDIFISAAENWMDEVEKAGLLVEGSRSDLLGNSLVLVGNRADAPLAPLSAPITAELDLAGALGDAHLAMAMVDAVPAGQYGKAALTHLDLWEAVAPRVVQSENVRAALALVSRGEAPLGIVYATDAAADPEVEVLGTFPEDSHPPILYPAALLQGAADAGDRAFFAHLCSASARAIFAAEGFSFPATAACAP